jgi:hypothetical protein
MVKIFYYSFITNFFWEGMLKKENVLVQLGCALTFASEAKFENEAKISFRFEAKKGLILHDSLRCETPKIWSENKGKKSKN